MNAALDALFRPLARLAIAKGLRFADVAERLRRAYFEVASELSGPNATASGLSVMTGLQRRDVQRLMTAAEVADAPKPDPLSKLVATWLTQHDGAPLVRHGAAGSFDALARSVRKDVHPKAMLDALIEAGTVQVDGDTVRLLARAYVPLEGSDAQINYLGQNVGDHLATAVGNVLGDDEKFDLAVHFDALSPEAVEALEALWRKQMLEILHDMNAHARAYQDTQTGTARFRAGGYFHAETKP